MPSTEAPDADDLPDPDAQDARRAVIGAARHDGLTCAVGAFKARRTWVEANDAWGTYHAQPVVMLSYRIGYGGDAVGLYRVRTLSDIRDDWTTPAPDWYSPGDTVLPAEDYPLQDIFLAPACLPGDDVDVDGTKGFAGDGGTDERTVRVGGKVIDPDELAWQTARKRPVEVQATPMPAPFEVDTLEGTMRGDEGDVLIRGVEGELYPCDADIFAQSYDVAPYDDDGREVTVDTDAGAVTVTLPDDFEGPLTVRRDGSHPVTVEPGGSETIPAGDDDA